MKTLHNRINRYILKEKIQSDKTPRVTLSFYQYYHLGNPELFRDHIYILLSELGVFGRIYVSYEGINAQISVPEARIEDFKNAIHTITFLRDIRLNWAIEDNGKSFYKLIIRVRDKIVADGLDDKAFDVTNKGIHLKAEEFNILTDDPETIIVDMRNHYEYEVGHFENAIEVPSDTFREQLPMAADMLDDKKDKHIIMYCTGGIRCEKASAYMLHRGFKNVFHLEGGIINYANKVKEAALPNKFHGKNFVFDERLGERISDEIISQCHQCGAPADTHTNCSNQACHLLFIQCKACAEKYHGCCSESCAEVIAMPEEEQKQLRKGIDKGRQVFNKSKKRLQEFVAEKHT